MRGIIVDPTDDRIGITDGGIVGVLVRHPLKGVPVIIGIIPLPDS
jgi:hypothetical protein